MLWISLWYELMWSLMHLSPGLLIDLNISAGLLSLRVREFHDVDMHINALVSQPWVQTLLWHHRDAPDVSMKPWNASVSVRLPELYGGLHSGRSRVRGSWCYIVWRKCPRPEATVYFWKVAYVRVWLQRPFKHAREALITIIRVTRWKTWI